MIERELLRNENTPPVALVWLVQKHYGTESHVWEPAVLRAELQEDFKCTVSDLQSDRIQASLTLLTTNHYETDLQAFKTFTNLFNGHMDDLDEFSVLEAEELVCGLAHAALVKHEPLEFSGEVRVYAGKIFWDYGFHKAPAVFPTAIMPPGSNQVGDDTAKNEALQELITHVTALDYAVMRDIQKG